MSTFKKLCFINVLNNNNEDDDDDDDDVDDDDVNSYNGLHMCLYIPFRLLKRLQFQQDNKISGQFSSVQKNIQRIRQSTSLHSRFTALRREEGNTNLSCY